MRPWVFLATALVVLAGIVTPVVAQSGGTSTRPSDGDGADIREVQRALKQNGHDPGGIDGVMGAQTSAALRAYQQEQGLSATGRLDAATLARLDGGSTSGARHRSSGSEPTGDAAVDPADAHKSGANVGEGASYNRSTAGRQAPSTGGIEPK